MPTRERVNAFVAAVVSGDHVAAIADFYHEDATMQENGLEPRRGRDVLLAHEAKALSRLQKMHTHPPKAVVLDGDSVVINWVFDAVALDGSARRLEELAFQTWRGDRILTERFFYDTATAWQSVPAPV
ncbi:polyketide cyclase [Elstera litoralis]|uniref:Polyketide cyclase n=1 Tax=Elstera litoralis TaxID=552518 RepID=A0A0F3IPV6_9PROT|nr:nuclear transport factor 2 family protein [Elstera litoralis]KJV08563.1 polyketide cyclase [Elstera litoralis]